ncbi:hypothetical protein [Leptolyngbya sp. Heron Island J]|nr:hypothetical protein [Leptolyngbya sp. Heron Island J]
MPKGLHRVSVAATPLSEPFSQASGDVRSLHIEYIVIQHNHPVFQTGLI